MTTALTIVDSVDGEILNLDSKSRKQIPNFRPYHDIRPGDLADIIRQYRIGHPNARVVSISAMYNCMGLVFASRRTNIRMETLDQIIAEDFYEPVPRLVAE